MSGYVSNENVPKKLWIIGTYSLEDKSGHEDESRSRISSHLSCAVLLTLVSVQLRTPTTMTFSKIVATSSPSMVSDEGCV